MRKWKKTGTMAPTRPLGNGNAALLWLAECREFTATVPTRSLLLAPSAPAPRQARQHPACPASLCFLLVTVHPAFHLRAASRSHTQNRKEAQHQPDRVRAASHNRKMHQFMQVVSVVPELMWQKM